MSIIYKPYVAGKWFAVLLVFLCAFDFVITIVWYSVSVFFLAIVLASVFFTLFMFNLSNKYVELTEHSVIIHDGKENRIFLWDDLPYAYLKKDLRRYWIILSKNALSDNEIKKKISSRSVTGKLTSKVKDECIMIPIEFALKGSKECFDFIITKYRIEKE